eukprot:ANDGO_05366.mRNA.1 hypothetical protein
MQLSPFLKAVIGLSLMLVSWLIAVIGLGSIPTKAFDSSDAEGSGCILKPADKSYVAQDCLALAAIMLVMVVLSEIVFAFGMWKEKEGINKFTTYWVLIEISMMIASLGDIYLFTRSCRLAKNTSADKNKDDMSNAVNAYAAGCFFMILFMTIRALYFISFAEPAVPAAGADGTTKAGAPAAGAPGQPQAVGGAAPAPGGPRPAGAYPPQASMYSSAAPASAPPAAAAQNV